MSINLLCIIVSHGDKNGHNIIMNRVDNTMFGIDATRPIPDELISQKFITVF